MTKTDTPLTRGATIYELTAEERAIMFRLIKAGLVVGIAEHARVKHDAARYRNLGEAIWEAVLLSAKSKGIEPAMTKEQFLVEFDAGNCLSFNVKETT